MGRIIPFKGIILEVTNTVSRFLGTVCINCTSVSIFYNRTVCINLIKSGIVVEIVVI